MKYRTSLTALLLLTVSATAFADAKDDLTAALAKTADSGNYSWTTTTEGGFGAGKTSGKTDKDGYTAFDIATRASTFDVIMKDKKAAIKTDSGWKTPEELTAAPATPPAEGGGGGRPRMDPTRVVAAQVQNFKNPLAQAKDNLDKVTDVKAEADGFTGSLPEDAAKTMMTMGGRRGGGGGAGGAAGGAAPAFEVKNPKVTFHVWIKDGQITKIENHVTGTITFNGNDRDIDRTTTTEITDVGTTKVEVPEEAKKKLEG